MDPNFHTERLHVATDELVDRVKELYHEGNVRHLRILHEGHTVLEIPVNVGVAGLVLAPMLAAVAAVAAALTKCTIEIVRTEPPAPTPPGP